LVVNAGPERSEVYVNGTFKGHSPFVGEIACERDAPIRVELIPEGKVPKRYERPCVPGTLLIEDE
jgi:hypothetical protein